jgi:hypothetical protein
VRALEADWGNPRTIINTSTLVARVQRERRPPPIVHSAQPRHRANARIAVLQDHDDHHARPDPGRCEALLGRLSNWLA